MAAPTKYNGLDEPQGLLNRREREFLRYAEAVFDLKGWESSDTARSSGDVSLTAFAQLVALRLNAKRVLITLYDKSFQYVLAEATRTLSLQQDIVHDDGDALFWGTSVLPRRSGLNSQALNAKDGEAVVFPDLLLEERYCSHPHVVGAPFARSYVGVPLRAPSGFPIGTLTVIDDKPRPKGVDRGETTFILDVAATIMSHLELARTKAVYHRGIKMVKGLSRFMEGKLPTRHARPRADNLKISSKRKRAEAMDLSDSDQASVASNAEFPDGSHRKGRDHRHPSVPRSPPVDRRLLQPDAVTDQVETEAAAQAQQVAVDAPRIALDSHTTTTKFDEDIVAKDIGEAFERGATIIKEAMDMAGVLFLHASAGALGDLRPPTGHTPEADGSEAGASTNGGSDDGLSVEEGGRKKSLTSMKMCRPLAAAYQPRKGETSDISHLSISERFLKSLMQRFPYGKIWNFSDNELLSSDEQSDSSVAPEFASAGTSVQSLPAKQRRLWADHEKILETFPGVRSFGIMPMWDSRSKRFFAGAIVWSYNTSRIFSMTDEINYLGAFCDVIMAEVGRLDVQADVQAKTTFISSISHELRSPLHGILGGVECLQELLDPSSGGQMLQMIDTCGRSLLDIINNLLDHAQASSDGGARGYNGKRRKRRNGYRLTPLESINDLAVLTEEVLDSALWSTPEPAPQSKPAKRPATAEPCNDEPLKVILEIDSSNLSNSGWNFHVNAGAWRRILQNLTTNAIKYTDRGGYFKVTLSMSNGESDNGSPTSMVELSCSDSGRGMSKEYLDHRLWQEFQQEETNVQGTGLGLSLVRNLVEEMGGTINVQSTKGVGTTITMSVPLTQGLPSGQQPAESIGLQRLKGLTFGLVGFGIAGDEDSRSAETTRILRSSIIRSCQSFGMHLYDAGAQSPTRPDVCIVSERDATSSMEIEGQAPSTQSFQEKPCIVLCDSASSSRVFTAHQSGWLGQATVVAQPLGPRKLLNALLACMSKTLTVSTGGEPGEMPGQLHNIREVDIHSPLKSNMEDAIQPVLKSLETLARGPVLLVDDNPVNLSLLQKSMEKLGRPQISAMNGLEAVEAYQNSLAKLNHDSDEGGEQQDENLNNPPVAIIFMDITMPVMDGLESTRRIRAYERALKLRPAKIAALTALASPQARQEAFGSGIDLFLTKPVRFKEIQGILEEWDRKFND